MKPTRSISFLALFGLGLAACDDSTGAPEPTGFDAKPVLVGVVDSVIVPTYQELASASRALKVACEAIVSEGATPTEIATAKTAWIAARKPWERSEAFLFGPVDQEGIDPSLDSWPVDTIGVQAILDGSDAITTTLLAGQDGTVKGFHTIERILWGSEAISGRRAQYLAAAASALTLDAERLVSAWTSGTAAKFRNAGADGSPWVSPSAAMEELVNGMIGIADEVGAGKIGGPVEEGNPLLEESRFSGNSIQDFQDNILGIRDVYLGSRGGASHDGFRLSVLSLDPASDAVVRAGIDSAVAAIAAIGPSFADGLANHPDRVRKASARCTALMEILVAKLAPLTEKVN